MEFNSVIPSGPQPGKAMDKPSKRKIVYRSEFHRFTCWLTEACVSVRVCSESSKCSPLSFQHPQFNNFILVVIAFNIILIALGTDTEFAAVNRELIDCCNLAFVVVFFVEFVVKVFAAPRGYWANGYNRFDFAVLLASFLQVLQLALAQYSIFSNLTFARVFRGAPSVCFDF
jgi:hypothetical protein